MNYPNLLVIGAMKCGTTSLHDYLNVHSDIFMSNPKELHYYDNLSNLSEAEYLSYFNSNEKIIGTTPQSYTKAHHKDFLNIPEKIFRDTPNVKLIYIVRDPFVRMKSHILEGLYLAHEKLEYTKNSGHYWKTSLYHYQISQYLNFFSKEQIHVLTLESLNNNRLVEMNKIFRFLGVSELKDENLFSFVKNDADSKTIPVFIKRKIWYRLMKKLSPSVAEQIGKKIIDKNHKNTLIKPNYNEIVSKEIIEEVRLDVLKFQKEFNLDISEWDLIPNLNE